MIDKSKHPEGEEDPDSDRDIDSDSDEEYDQEFVFKPGEDIYELPLKGGHYMIVIRYPALQQMHEHVHISPLDDCNTILHYQLEQVLKK